MTSRRSLRAGALALALASVSILGACSKSDSSDTTVAAETEAAATDTTVAADTPAETTVAADTTVAAETSAAATDTAAAAAGGELSAVATGVTCPKDLKFIFLGARSGDNGQLGTNMALGAQVAFELWNKANPDCQLNWDGDGYDSQGDPAQASPLADKIATDKAIVGIVGPGFSGETKAVMPKFEEAGLSVVSPSATATDITANGWKMFHRVVANDDAQAPGIATLIRNQGATKVGVIDDGQEYGKALADLVRKDLGELKVADDTIDTKASDFSAAVNKMKAAGVDFIFYGGYYGDAAKLIKQLRDSGVTAPFAGGDGLLDKAFIDNAGAPTAEGTFMTSTGAPVDINPAFAAAHKAILNTDPGLYGPEAYDAATIFLKAVAAGKYTRAEIAEFVTAYDGDGITKHIKFTETGEVEGDSVYSYQVKDGAIVSLGIIK